MRESERKNELLLYHPNSTGYIIFNDERKRERERNRVCECVREIGGEREKEFIITLSPELNRLHYLQQ